MARGSRGPQGYPDWQRQSASVSPTLSKQVNSIRPGPTTIGPLYVANFNSVTGIIFSGGEPVSAERCTVRFDWFTDSAFNQIAGRTDFTLTQFVAEHLYQFILPNQGAWCRIIVSALGEGLKHNCGWNIAGTNREQLNPNPTAQPTLLSKEHALKSGEGNAWVPEYDFAGPVLTTFRASKTLVLVKLITFNLNTGSPEAIIVHQNTEAGVFEEFTWLTPLGSWELQVKNENAEECTYSVQMTPAVSGSG